MVNSIVGQEIAELKINRLTAHVAPGFKRQRKPLVKVRININGPRRQKTGLRGFREGLTQTDLYSQGRRLEA